MRSLLQETEAVPAWLTWVNETGGGRGERTEPTAAFPGTIGTQIKLSKARDPESKGKVVRMNRLFRSRTMSERALTSPDDFIQQLAS